MLNKREDKTKRNAAAFCLSSTVKIKKKTECLVQQLQNRTKTNETLERATDLKKKTGKQRAACVASIFNWRVSFVLARN